MLRTTLHVRLIDFPKLKEARGAPDSTNSFTMSFRPTSSATSTGDKASKRSALPSLPAWPACRWASRICLASRYTHYHQRPSPTPASSNNSASLQAKEGIGAGLTGSSLDAPLFEGRSEGSQASNKVSPNKSVSTPSVNQWTMTPGPPSWYQQLLPVTKNYLYNGGEIRCWCNRKIPSLKKSCSPLGTCWRHQNGGGWSLIIQAFAISRRETTGHGPSTREADKPIP